MRAMNATPPIGSHAPFCYQDSAHPAPCHDRYCRCAPCRHDRFNPGPPSMTKRQRRERAHGEAMIEDAERTSGPLPNGS